jgi:1,4-alpha-glucan branching enzyme
MPEGELALVLHTHMPYVEGFGTWPFGEEWLWEAAATSYVPLLRVLDELGPDETRKKLTLSLTPVLCDQLEAPGAIERCIRFLKEIRPESHRLDIEDLKSGNDPQAVAELERSAADYAHAAETLARLEYRATPGTRASQGGLVQALGRHALWTSSATHAILPLLVVDESIDLQIRVGIESHRHRFGEWDGGFWSPECAHAPWLNRSMLEEGVHATCVELTQKLGHGDERNLRPLKPHDGPTLFPLDRAVVDLMWGERGYPSRPAYRAYSQRTTRDHHVQANDGSTYDHERAKRQANDDAKEFVSAVKDRLANGGLCVCAFDTELLGHWWYEGPLWLEAVLKESERQQLQLTALDQDTIIRHAAVPVGIEDLPPATSWGTGGDLRTWSAPAVADLAWQARTAEFNTFVHGGATPSRRALRELMALQSSDWAFLAYRDWAGDYPRQRASGHAAQLARALKGETEEPHVRNLAPYLDYS